MGFKFVSKEIKMIYPINCVLNFDNSVRMVTSLSWRLIYYSNLVNCLRVYMRRIREKICVFHHMTLWIDETCTCYRRCTFWYFYIRLIHDNFSRIVLYGIWKKKKCFIRNHQNGKPFYARINWRKCLDT